jgi:hypothetical protein
VDSLGSYGDASGTGGNNRLTTSSSVDVEDSYVAKAVGKHETILLRLTPAASP